MSYVDVDMAHAPTDSHFRASGLKAEVLHISAVRVRLHGKREMLQAYLTQMGYSKAHRIIEDES